jgi:hypothetical protein
MIRVTILVLVLFFAGSICVAFPRIPLRLVARLLFVITATNTNHPSSPEWISHYIWATSRDPVSNSVRRLEEAVRIVGFFVVAPMVFILIIILFN